MNVAELRKLLEQYPDDMPVKVRTDDGNAHCHEDPIIQSVPEYRVSFPSPAGGAYHTVHAPVLEIS
jgi:hypothetical protein